MNRILIGGTHSGCGKTTVTCALLKALSNRGLRVSSFKCGPDYIDPMFHKKIIGVDAHNLDSFFCSDNTLKFLLHEYASQISVIEGVMGFYDGANGRGSAHSVSKITETPAAIVVDCKGMSESIGAVLSGFLAFQKPNNIRGFIFNRLPERLRGLAEELCERFDVEYLGCFPNCDFSLESRHLGLVTADEIPNIKERLKRLGELAENNLRIDRIIEISNATAPNFTPIKLPENRFSKPVKIAVTRDKAFCFLYSENLDLLKKLGCELEYFSPLSDEKLPQGISGLILCGGYPELYARELSENKKMLLEIQNAISKNLPTIAECGGFMYLHKSLCNAENEQFDLVGTINAAAQKTDKLQRFGYANLRAKRDNLLCNAGESFPVHEFHYWSSTDCGEDFTSEKPDGRLWECVHAAENLYAGFPHLYFYSDIKIAENFVKKCAEFGGIYG